MTASYETIAKRITGERRPPVSVVIFVRNDSEEIDDCIAGCTWCDDVHVIDSSPRGLPVSAGGGAKVHRAPFVSYAQHRNWAIDNIATKHPWQFHIYPEERFTLEQVDELQRKCSATPAASHAAAFRCPTKIIFMGKWVRHSSVYPSYDVRLFDPKQVRFVDEGTSTRESTNGAIGVLKCPILHLSMPNGWIDWFNQLNRDSSLEANDAVAFKISGAKSFPDLFSGSGVTRRRALRHMSYSLLFRATLRFFYRYMILGGWLDAVPGFHYCALIAMSEYWTELKIREGLRRWPRRTDERDAIARGDGIVNDQPRVDILIPALNEASHIARAIANAQKLGTVFVLDSMSTDGTQEIAKNAGAIVIEHKFVNYAAQKNWGLDNIPFAGDWIFILDADERITPKLRAEILQRITNNSPVEGYFINRRMLIMGQEVRHGGLYPSWNLRLFRRGRARYEERTVHEHMVCQGATDYVNEPMLHIRSETIDQYITKHIRYADLESEEWVKRKLGRSGVAGASELFKHSLRLRQWLRREIWPQLPMRPLWRFLYMYVVRLGFLDGRAGWHLARLMFCYEYMITLLYKEKIEREDQMIRRQRTFNRST